MIKIEITISDEETIENYGDVEDELIIDDFVNNASAWIHLIGTKIRVNHLTSAIHSDGELIIKYQNVAGHCQTYNQCGKEIIL